MGNYQYKNRKTPRMQNWDYTQNAAYFITICTANRENYFGEIIDDKMILSPTGILADVFWHEIKNHAKFVELDEFVVMPNHIHGILILNNPIGTGHALSLSNANAPSQPLTGENRFQNIGKNSVSAIIGSYKSAVTKHANRLKLPNEWQTRFHDHIIRNDDDFDRIKNYIANNPKNWKDDKFKK
ncbi:MAG: transposase [Bacteroidetes bacterium]|nr:MAG: transposase [Bacteroidota bacterium]